MRRSAAAALLLAPALLLTACGSSKSSSTGASPSASASASAPAVPAAVDAADPMPAVGGSFGSSATLTLPSGAPSGKFVVHTVNEGSGDAVTSADYAVANVLIKDWTSGKTLTDTYDSKTPLLVTPSESLIPAILKAVVGHKAGSRVLVVAPPAAAAAQMSSASKLGVKPTDTLAMVVDVNKRISPHDSVSGTESSAPAGLPAVDASGKKAAVITVPKGAKPPTSLKTAVLIKGSGPKVTRGQTIVVQYTGALWSNGKIFDSSWNHSGAYSTQIGVGAVVKGWDDGLVGQTVGSRVELVVPPSFGYGSQSSNGIPANSTLVFVVDILAAA